MNRKHFILVLSISLICAGISSGQKSYNVEKSRVIYKPYDQTWWNALAWFGLNGIYVNNARYEHGFIDTESTIDTAYFKEIMDISEVEKNLPKYVKLENPTAVFKLVFEEAQRYHVSLTRQDPRQVVVHLLILYYIEGNVYDTRGKIVSTKQYLCRSTGTVEKDFFDYIDIY